MATTPARPQRPLAQTLDATVVTVLDTWAASQSAAAVALGLRAYDPRVRHLGVLAAIERHDHSDFPERMLGLDRGAFFAGTTAIEKLAAELSTQIDLGALIDATAAAALDTPAPMPKMPARARIAYAEDAAFWFTYPETLDALRAAGADLVPFSPLEDRELPSDIGALWTAAVTPKTTLRRSKQTPQCGKRCVTPSRAGCRHTPSAAGSWHR
jgi:cobyrinic acid a,c-diamide synthase